MADIGVDELEDNAQSPTPNQEQQLWAYIPQEWDHAELVEAYQQNPYPVVMPDQELEVTLLSGEDNTGVQTTLSASGNSFRLSVTRNVFFKDVRYVTTNCRWPLDIGDVDGKDPTAGNEFVIMISIRQWGEMSTDYRIVNVFLKTETAEHALTVLNFLQYHLFQYMRSATETEDPTVALQYIRPLCVQEVSAEIYNDQKKTFVSWERTLVIIDQGSISLYKNPFQEETETTIFLCLEEDFEACLCFPREQPLQDNIILVSKDFRVTLKTDIQKAQEMLDIIKGIQLLPKQALQDQRCLFRWLGGNIMDIADSSECADSADSDLQIEELDDEDIQLLDRWEKNIYAGSSPHSREQYEALWHTIRPDLERMGLQVPVDEPRWDYCRESVTDLLNAFCRVEKKMIEEVNYAAALNVMEAVKNIFQNSKVRRIRELMRKPTIDLLYEIYIRCPNIPRRPPPVIFRQCSSHSDQSDEDSQIDDEEDIGAGDEEVIVYDGEGSTKSMTFDDTETVPEADSGLSTEAGPEVVDEDAEFKDEKDGMPVAAADANFVSEADTNFVSEADANFVSEADTDSVAEAGANFVAEADANFVAEAGTDSVAEADANFVAEADANFVAEADANFAAEVDTSFVAEADTKPMVESDLVAGEDALRAMAWEDADPTW